MEVQDIRPGMRVVWTAVNGLRSGVVEEVEEEVRELGVRLDDGRWMLVGIESVRKFGD